MVRNIVVPLAIVILVLSACGDPAPQPVLCPSSSSPRAVLVDATHDGGAWWFPQGGPFISTQPHQGEALADTLRAKGYAVDELARGDSISLERLLAYQVVIRAGNYGAYAMSELHAYEAFVACPRTLLLLGDLLGPTQHDDLADSLGVPLIGAITGSISAFVAHQITAGVTAVPFIAGSYVDPTRPASAQVLGRLDNGLAVMGLQPGYAAKVFFIGDTNGLETVPQPLVNNLVSWGF